MSKLVKILLAILAVLLVAAGGFWSGTRFAYQQLASDPSRQAAIAAPAVPGAGQNNNQGSQDSGDRRNDNGPQANSTPDDNQNSPRQSGGKNSFGPGMMGSNERRWGNFNQNSNPMMPGFDRNNQPGGMMAVHQNNGGFGMFAGGGLMGGAFMLFGLLFPLGFGILMVLGIIILFRMVRQPSPASVAVTSPCTKCGASLQSGWSHCPHCGETIQK
jgi:hypothetical protein